jgi:hypothetical protein
MGTHRTNEVHFCLLKEGRASPLGASQRAVLIDGRVQGVEKRWELPFLSLKWNHPMQPWPVFQVMVKIRQDNRSVLVCFAGIGEEGAPGRDLL